MVITLFLIQIFGDMNQDPPFSVYVLMTLESSITQKLMQIIFFLPWLNITSIQLIGKVLISVAILLIGTVDLSMPTYIPALLKKFNHPPTKAQHSPHEFFSMELPQNNLQHNQTLHHF